MLLDGSETEWIRCSKLNFEEANLRTKGEFPSGSNPEGQKEAGQEVWGRGKQVLVPSADSKCQLEGVEIGAPK